MYSFTTGETMGRFFDALARNRAHIEEMARDPVAYLQKIAETDGEPNHIPPQIRELPQGTVLFLPGSPGRAKDIADYVFDERTATHPNNRAFDLYAGTVCSDDKQVPVASMTSHMGFPSL